ncbi:hypothetical protein R3P38DRAFT_2792368 [Favolaschia claudopus]|uniref:Uncharacterized protein n=1 Tax=Favolaschia claudopus TaxID=2862362 RepID=A0AAW0AEW1_9AGAR
MEAPASSTSLDSIRTIHLPLNHGSSSSPSASPPSSPSSPASSVSSFPSVSSSFFFSSAAASPPHPHSEHQGVQHEGEGVEETLIIPSLALPAPLLIQRLPPPHTRTHTLVPLSNRHRPSKSRRSIDGPTTRLLVIGDVDAVAAALLPAHPHHHRESDVWASAGEEEDEDGSRILRFSGDPAIELVALGGDVSKIDFPRLHHRLLRPFHRLARVLAPPSSSSFPPFKSRSSLDLDEEVEQDDDDDELLTSLLLSPESPLYTALLVCPPRSSHSPSHAPAQRQSATMHASEPTVTLTSTSTTAISASSSSSLEIQSDPSSIAIPRGPPPSIVSGSAADSSTSLSSGAAPVSSPSAVDAEPPPPINQDSSPTDPQSNGNRIANPAADAILAAIPEVIGRLVPVIVVPAPVVGDDDVPSSPVSAGAADDEAGAAAGAGDTADSSTSTSASTSTLASTSTKSVLASTSHHNDDASPSTSTSTPSTSHNNDASPSPTPSPRTSTSDNEPGTARLPAHPSPRPPQGLHPDTDEKAQQSIADSKLDSQSSLRSRLTARPARLAAAKCFLGWWRGGGGYESAGYAGYDYAGYGFGGSQPFGYSGVQDGGEGEEVYSLSRRRALPALVSSPYPSYPPSSSPLYTHAHAAHDPLNLSSILRLAGEVWRAWKSSAFTPSSRGYRPSSRMSSGAEMRSRGREGGMGAWIGVGVGVGAFVCGMVLGVGVGRCVMCLVLLVSWAVGYLFVDCGYAGIRMSGAGFVGRWSDGDGTAKG